VTPRYAIGVAGRQGVDAPALTELVRLTASRWGVAAQSARLVAPERPEDRAAFEDAAAAFGVPLVFLPMAELRARAGDVLSHSPRVAAMFGVGSVAEALALIGAGADSRLLGPRVATARLTCAIAQASGEGDGP